MDFIIDLLTNLAIGGIKIAAGVLILGLLLILTVRAIRIGSTGGGVPYNLIGSIKTANSILVLDLKGPILDEPSSVNPFARRFATFGSEMYAALASAAANANIVGVVIKCATPGGSPAGSELIAQGVALCKEAKPVFAHVTTMCASGGVWALAGASKINASAESYVGSIGVLGPSLVRYKDVTELGSGLFGGHVQAKEVTVNTLHRGKGKTFGSPFVDAEPDVLKHYEDMIGSTYDRFVAKVAKARNLAEKTVRDLGALVYDAPTAFRKGLIDGVGTFQDTLTLTAKAAGLKVEDCSLVRARRPIGMRSQAIAAEIAAAFVGPGVAMQEISATLRQNLVLTISPLFFNDR